LADIGGQPFWRIDANADYGELNAIARQCVSLDRIEKHWDDFLRLAGSLKLGRMPATGILRTLQAGGSANSISLGSGPVWSNRKDASYIELHRQPNPASSYLDAIKLW